MSISRFLSIWAFVWFVSSPLGVVFAVLEKQAYFLKLNIVIFCTRFGSLLIGGLLGDPLIALGLFAVTGIVIYGYMNWSVMRISGVSQKFVKMTLLHNCILFIPAFLLLGLLKFLNASNLIITCASVVVLAGYYVYLMKTNDKVKEIFNQVAGRFIRI